MATPRGFEHRARLPRVLNEVHRQTIARYMTQAGINIGKGTWDDLTRLNDDFHRVYPEKTPLTMEYDRSYSFGPLFGKPHYLVESCPTHYLLENSSHVHFPLDCMEILIQDATAPALREGSRILLLPGIAPVAIHGDDYRYITEQYPQTTLNDTFIVDAVRKSFGQEALEFLSEDVAKGVAYALQHDTVTIADW